MHETVPSVDQVRCQKTIEMLGRIGDKWTVLIIMTLQHGPQRFNELKRMIVGVSQQMLTRTLKNLERDGLVSRTVHPTVPPRVDYALTDLGVSLTEPVTAMGEWVRGNLADIHARRAVYDRAQDS